MTLKQYQENILNLLKGKPFKKGAEDEYFESLKDSLELEVVNDISIWWRSLQIEKYCYLTSSYLKKINKFDSIVRNYYQNTSVSPYIEIASTNFFTYVNKNFTTNDLLISIAMFEDCLIKVRKGDFSTYNVNWNYEPLNVIDYLLDNNNLSNNNLLQGSYLTIISAKIDNLFKVIKK